ncbi:NAD(P)-binding Rossmann-fold superfamily protein [Tanacetum coccineum]
MQRDVVVNCVARSIPHACEIDPSLAMSVNVPSSLVKWLSSFTKSNSFLIHLSTHQVYEGTSSYYKAENETLHVNVYGKSKVAAEEYISSNWSNFAILRNFQCWIETMKLDLMTMEQSFLEANKIQEEVAKSLHKIQEMTKNYKDEFKSLFHPDPPTTTVDFDDVSSYPDTSLKSTAARRSGWNRLLNSSC